MRPAQRSGRAAALMAVVLLVLLPSCTPAEPDRDPSPSPASAEAAEQPAAGPTSGPTPGPTSGPPAVAGAEVDPCLLSEQEVADIVGVELPLAGASGGELFALCTYGGEEASAATPGTVDIALVDLERVSQESEEQVSGDAYIDELTSGVGTGTATPLSGLGEGRAVRLTYAFGSQAWAWVDDHVYGAYVSDLDDAGPLAEDVLRAVLATQGTR